MDEAENPFRINGTVLDKFQQAVAFFVLPQRPGEKNFATEGDQVIGDVGRAAQGQVFRAVFEDRDRGFRGNAVHIAPDIFVKDKVAHHEDLGTLVAVEKMFEFTFHRSILVRLFRR